ncbi:MAG TPA: DUF1521 domain-containing protein [Pyrinomonadaceae bacterium]|nr:DUF1521 domain-containing protein [Pyrinomonadaceae bacterium]
MTFSLEFSSFRLLGFDPSALQSLSPEAAALLSASGKLLQAYGDFAATLAQLTNGQPNSSPACQCAPVSSPAPEDSCHPAGSLSVEGDIITTPGGYKIEQLGQYEWKITGPDGKSTRIWGDPHVDEGDRDGAADWDFKRNSTFVLPDGTHINVTTVPGGAEGMTVTGQLEVINGVDRVLVTDIDKGKGKIGTVTQDGHLYLDKFKGDVIRMGRESDDWSFEGREIVGSRNGGDELVTGNELHPGSIGYEGPNNRPRFDNPFEWAMSMFNDILGQWANSFRPNSVGTNPYYDEADDVAPWQQEGRRDYDQRRHMETLGEAFRAFGEMLVAFSRFTNLGEQLAAGRRQQNFAV